jgi:hypothetical protein
MSTVLVTHHKLVGETGAKNYVVPNGLKQASELFNNLEASNETQRLTSHFWNQTSLQKASLCQWDTAWNGHSQNDVAHLNREAGLDYFAALYQSILDKHEPSFALIWNGYHPQEQILICLLQSRNVPVWYIERAPLPGMIHVDPVGILAESEPALLPALSYNKKFASVGQSVITSVRASSGKVTWWNQPDDDQAYFKYVLEQIRSTKIIILFTGQVDQDIQNIKFNPIFGDSITAFTYLLDLLSDYSDSVFVLGKHHPLSSQPVSLYQKAIDDRNVDGLWTDKLSLHQCFTLSTHVASVNSTTLFEALNLSKPVLSMGMSLLSNKDIAYELSRSNGDSTVLESWLFSDELSFRNEKWLSFLGYLVNHSFYAFVSPATQIDVPISNADVLACRIVSSMKHSLLENQLNMTSRSNAIYNPSKVLSTLLPGKASGSLFFLARMFRIHPIKRRIVSVCRILSRMTGIYG